jgi:hypothetical protein
VEHRAVCILRLGENLFSTKPQKYLQSKRSSYLAFPIGLYSIVKLDIGVAKAFAIFCF